MHDPRRAVNVDRATVTRTHAARLRRFDSHCDRFSPSVKNRTDDPNVEAGQLESWKTQATRRDQRALKGTKAHERRFASANQAVKGKTQT
jgi:hypothetical protein